MKKAIRTMILLAAGTAAVMTPALAANRDQGEFGSAYRTDNRVTYGTADRETRRDDNGRGGEFRLRNERFRHDRYDRR
jgi:hypothetical protein